jgi:hypothetical protein
MLILTFFQEADVAAGTTSRGNPGPSETTAGPPGDTASDSVGAAGPHPGRIVLLRDELGALSVMCCLDDGLVFDPGFQRDYRAESAALEGLAETRVAPPLSYVVDATGRIVAVVRRHVAGVLLSDVLERMARGLDVQTATTVVNDVLIALAALHRRGVAHRSVDPQHVVVEPDGGCVLIDVGLTPRSGGLGGSGGSGAADSIGAAAEDLAAVPELFAACVTTGLPAEPGVRGGYFAPGELEGVSQDLYTVLSGAQYAQPGPWDGVGAAPGMLAALTAAAADSFDAGWDDRGRERLASAAAQTPPPTRGRFFDFVPMGRGRGGRARPRRGRRAATSSLASAPGTQLPGTPGAGTPAPGAAALGTPAAGTRAPGTSAPGTPVPVPVPAPIPARPGMARDISLDTTHAWQSAAANASRLTGEWLGEAWHVGGGRRAAGRRVSGHRSKSRARISWVAIPLLAFLVVFALIRVVFSGSATSDTASGSNPSTTSAAQAPGQRQAAVPVGTPSSQPSGAAPSSSASASSTQTVQAVTDSKPPAPTAVTAVSITSLAFDSNTWGQATVTVDVRTSGTAPIAVALEIDEPGGYFGGGGTSVRTDHFPESGRQDYIVSDSFPVATFCSRTGGPQVVAAVTVTATVPGTADGPMTATAQLSSVRC